MRVSQSSGVECEKRGVRWFASIQGDRLRSTWLGSVAGKPNLSIQIGGPSLQHAVHNKWLPVVTTYAPSPSH